MLERKRPTVVKWFITHKRVMYFQTRGILPLPQTH